MPPTLTPLTAPQRELAEANLALADSILRTHFVRYRRRIEVWHAAKGAAYQGLCLAAQRYDPVVHRTAFSTFAYPTIWGTIKNVLAREELRAIKYTGHIDPEQKFDELAIDHRELSVQSVTHNSDLRDILSDALRHVHSLDAEIVRLRFGLRDGIPVGPTEIARRMNRTRQLVREKLTRAMNRLRTVLEPKRSELEGSYRP